MQHPCFIVQLSILFLLICGLDNGVHYSAAVEGAIAPGIGAIKTIAFSGTSAVVQSGLSDVLNGEEINGGKAVENGVWGLLSAGVGSGFQQAKNMPASGIVIDRPNFVIRDMTNPAFNNPFRSQRQQALDMKNARLDFMRNLTDGSVQEFFSKLTRFAHEQDQ